MSREGGTEALPQNPYFRDVPSLLQRRHPDFSACNRKEIVEVVKKYLLKCDTLFVIKACEINCEFLVV